MGFVLMCGVSIVRSSKPELKKAPLTPQLFSKGETLYNQNCASCHGAGGDGQGKAAYLLYPKPRNFKEGLFRLVSTTDQQPTNVDFFNSITRGMPGSGMPPWSHLAEEDRWSLAYYVRYLTELGKEASSGNITEEQIKKGVSAETKLRLAGIDANPESAIQVPVEPAVTKEGIARGQTLYTQACASCHGPQGKGDGQQLMMDNAGLPIRPRDLTAGVFKGSSGSDDLWYRINAGLPGSPMPGYQGAYSDDQLWDLIHYVQTLPKPGAEQKARLSRQQITVARVKEKLDNNPSAPRWQNVKPVSVSLTPLWWRDDRVEAVQVKVLHDGKQLAVHLSWEDSSDNSTTIAPQSFSDGAALQLSLDPNPPFFAMGDNQGAVTFWHWKSSWQKDLKSRSDVQSAYPHAAVDHYSAQLDYKKGSAFEVKDSNVATHDSTYVTGWGAGNPLSNPNRQSAAEEAHAKGFGTLTSTPVDKDPVIADGVWKDGRWHVVFLRPLKVKEKGRLEFKPGQRINVAFAVWNGQAKDRNGQKMVSIWNEFTLEK
jgi:mono/diheme cytochrome c family protein